MALQATLAVLWPSTPRKPGRATHRAGDEPPPYNFLGILANKCRFRALFLIGVHELTGDPALKPAADHQRGSIARAIQRADETIKRYANPPRGDPDAPSSLDKTWKGAGDEVSMYRAALATGKQEYVVALLEEAAGEFERNRFLLTEAEPFTDRVPVPASKILRYMYLGGDCAGRSHVPGLAVSWEGGGTDFAAFVLEGSRESLKVLLHSFAPEPLEMAMRTWKLERGQYEWSFGLDDDANDIADSDIERRELELFRYARVPFTLPPGRTAVTEIKQLEKLEPLTRRPDLALSEGDIKRVDERTIEVTVHNIGSVLADNIVVRLVDPDGIPRAREIIERIRAPLDLKPKTEVVELAADQPVTDAWSVTLDAEGRIAEVCEENNTVLLGEPRGRFVYLAGP